MTFDSHRSARRPPPAAFSVLELLVAVGILAIIIVGLLAMFYQTQRAFRSGAMQVDVLESGRAISQLLSSDLQELTAPEVASMLNLTATSHLALVLPLTSGGNGLTREYRMQDLAFITQPKNATTTNDEWVGTIYAITNAGLGVGTLYRYVTNFPLDQSTFPSATLSNLYLTLQNPPPTDFHRVAEGIVHFKLLAYDANGLLFSNSFVYSNSFGIPAGGMTLVNQLNGDYDYYFTNYLPSYLDVELGVLDPRAVAQFRARVADPKLPLQFGNPLAWNYLTGHVGSIHLFKQRIPIRNPSTAP